MSRYETAVGISTDMSALNDVRTGLAGRLDEPRIPADVTVRLVIAAPTAETPGYLRRQRRALALSRDFRALQSENETGADRMERLAQALDAIVAFCLDYVVEPVDRALATDAVLDLSETRLMALLEQLRAGGTQPPLASTDPTTTSATG